MKNNKKKYLVKFSFGSCEVEDPTIKTKIREVKSSNIKNLYDEIKKQYYSEIHDCDFINYEVINLTLKEKEILHNEQMKKEKTFDKKNKDLELEKILENFKKEVYKN